MSRAPGGRLKILDIERKLGVWFPLGLSRHKDRLKIPLLKDFNEDIKRLTTSYGGKNQAEIRDSETLRIDAENLFQKYGPELWSDDTQDRLRWLADASQTSLNGAYPRDLYYSKQEDRAELWESFYLLIVAKCIRYYENHGRGWHYEPEPLDSQAEETVDRDALNGAVDHVLGSGRAASEHEEVDSSLNQRSPEAQKRHSNFTPVNSINYYIEDGEPPEQLPAEDSSTGVPHRSRKRSSIPGTEANFPATKRPRTEAPLTTVSSAEQTASHSFANLPADSRMPPPAPAPTERYGAQGPSPITGINPIASEVLGPYMDSPVVSQLIGPNGPKLARPDWERIRSVFENVPASRVDAQTLVTELSKSTTNPSAESPLDRQPNGVKPEPQHSPGMNPTGHSTLPSFASVAQPSPENRPSEAPRPNITPLGSSSGLPNVTSWRAAGPATQPPQPPTNAASRVGTPAQHHRHSLDPQYLDMTPPTGDYSDALERAELEIDWWADNEPSGWLQLEAGDDVGSFFRKIDEEMPPRLKDRAVRAVRVEHLNPPPHSGKAFNGRIRRGAEAGFKALVRRLRQLRDASTPELTVTVEWEG
ncbi:hypothetical protein KC332_g10353 [Hortaea werneckii]|uniref:DUF7071 domain-containing protein n=2 Tax=Hortaea werneckii TaxID=91943 RepID=A0A3M7IEF1_HORWE|nr:hypothetical protein KC358_g13734 [Hortaea werneckii]OTA22712.1 hypothetical protein BTJ68_13423 [Hortaea werneckii EXF-2000]KAI6808229.1 hypothetical protein KC350_g13419 [Hortaea werneckii]KAI6915931.1 hypothetical protein KC348_g11784 [Hortaea werneckii]KAI6939970.1 hypothetical protein KC341_g3828 [Hortaea werneckii]